MKSLSVCNVKFELVIPHFKCSGERNQTRGVPEKLSQPESTIVIELFSPECIHKRRKCHVGSEAMNKPCINSDKANCKGSNERFQFEDTKCAVNSLNTYKFNKDIHTRCILYKSAKGLFAADIMYHKSCMEGYLLPFKRNVENIANFQAEEKEY